MNSFVVCLKNIVCSVAMDVPHFPSVILLLVHSFHPSIKCSCANMQCNCVVYVRRLKKETRRKPSDSEVSYSSSSESDSEFESDSLSDYEVRGSVTRKMPGQ